MARLAAASGFQHPEDTDLIRGRMTDLIERSENDPIKDFAR